MVFLYSVESQENTKGVSRSHMVSAPVSSQGSGHIPNYFRLSIIPLDHCPQTGESETSFDKWINDSQPYVVSQEALSNFSSRSLQKKRAQIWAQILSVPFTSCVTLSHFLSF